MSTSLPLRNSLLALLLLVTPQYALSNALAMPQQNRQTSHALPTIKANSPLVDIQDGNHLLKGNWRISPDTKLDIYYAKRDKHRRRITFHTDIDAISFDVTPGRNYDFDILLNGKDICHTRISTLRRSYERIDKRSSPDEIPFTLGKDGKIHVLSTINGSKPLDLLFDTGADSVVVFPSAFTKGLKMAFDGVASNLGFGGVTTRQTSRENRLEVSNLRWDHEGILFIDQQADSADGIIGFNVFEDKVVEIDYDRQVITLHDALPKTIGQYTKIPTQIPSTIPLIQITLDTGTVSVTDWFSFDTGSNSSLHLNQKFSQANQLYGTMKKIGASQSGGVGNGVVDNDIVLLPTLTVGGMQTHNIAVDQEKPTSKGFVAESIVGMEVLKRFNAIIDCQRNQIYLQQRTGASSP